MKYYLKSIINKIVENRNKSKAEFREKIKIAKETSEKKAENNNKEMTKHYCPLINGKCITNECINFEASFAMNVSYYPDEEIRFKETSVRCKLWNNI